MDQFSELGIQLNDMDFLLPNDFHFNDGLTDKMEMSTIPIFSMGFIFMIVCYVNNAMFYIRKVAMPICIYRTVTDI